jgi:hypothetical protein
MEINDTFSEWVKDISGNYNPDDDYRQETVDDKDDGEDTRMYPKETMEDWV